MVSRVPCDSLLSLLTPKKNVKMENKNDCMNEDCLLIIFPTILGIAEELAYVEWL